MVCLPLEIKSETGTSASLTASTCDSCNVISHREYLGRHIGCNLSVLFDYWNMVCLQPVVVPTLYTQKKRVLGGSRWNR